MTRRLLYYFFWNFYDYLGSYLVMGSLSVGALLVMLTLASLVSAHVPVGAVQAALTLVVGAAALVLVAATLAGTFAFATRAAQGEPARFPHVREGIRQLFWPYLKLLVIVVLVLVLVVGDILVYLRMSGSTANPGLRQAMALAAMIFGWLGVGLFIYLHAAFAAPARFADRPAIGRALRKSFILFMLAPAFWLFVALLSLFFSVLCLVSVIGLLFIVPLFASLTTTAFHLLVQQVEFLEKAREELGEGRSVAEYKRRARELTEEWQARQPHRGFKELIKPWEM